MCFFTWEDNSFIYAEFHCLHIFTDLTVYSYFMYVYFTARSDRAGSTKFCSYEGLSDGYSWSHQSVYKRSQTLQSYSEFIYTLSNRQVTGIIADSCISSDIKDPSSILRNTQPPKKSETWQLHLRIYLEGVRTNSVSKALHGIWFFFVLAWLRECNLWEFNQHSVWCHSTYSVGSDMASAYEQN